MIRAAALGALGALLLAGAAGGEAQPGREGPRRGMFSPNPSAVVAAELAFARLAKDKGQWTAFRETADKDAVMFVPQAVNAQAWLKKRVDPPQSVGWKPARVIVSCDGSYALSTGPAFHVDGKTGMFSTIWRRQKDGNWKWVIDLGSDTRLPPADDGIIEGRVAQCAPRDRASLPVAATERREARAPDPALIPVPPPASGAGQSADGSLRWRWTHGDGRTLLEVMIRTADGEETVLRESTPAPAAEERS